MHARNIEFDPYSVNEGVHMFEPIPQEDWLTSRQIAKRLPDTTSYSRVVEVLQELRKIHTYSDSPVYVLIGKAYLYHPDFVQLVDSREKRRGVKSQNPNKK